MKGKSSGDSKKTEKKKQEKVIEDRTFGLKNKNKSKTVQKFIKGVATQVKNAGQISEQRLAEEEHAERKRKKKEEEDAALLASLFKSVETVKAKAAEDEEEDDGRPQICAYFKQGLCQKGKKCKYSHDLNSEVKNENVDLYTDQRLQIYGTKEEEETVEHWDAKKLEEIVKQKEQKYKNKNNTTMIVCKFFLDAVEKGKYNWKWICPNGMECIYRHCLPPGFVFKKKGVDLGNDLEPEILEEKLEEERAKLTGVGTPVTLERFLAWKEARKKKKEEEVEEKRKAEEKKTGGKHHALTGRALFKFDPTLFVDDEEAAGDKDYEIREEDKEEDEEGELVPPYKAAVDDEEEAKKDEEELMGEDFEFDKATHSSSVNPKEEVEAKVEGDGAGGDAANKKKKKKKKKAAGGDDLKVNEDLFNNEEDVDL